ncbi:MAG: glycosyltransferase [Candidatus Eremiobacteraeota bacterium]|nr:glycosyltransferase [Candidatus Eremiobacteraeota bacterium]
MKVVAMQQAALRVGFFTECYRPIVNGVVASVDALADGLRARRHEVYCFAPNVPGYAERPGPVFRMPSLPLPLKTPYRLTLPLVSRRNLNGIIRRLSIIHAHSPFITGWMSVWYARRFGIPLVYTYHTQLEQYAHYVPFDAKAIRAFTSTLTRAYANAADAVVVPTAAMADQLVELGVRSRIEVVPSGIDVSTFASGKRRDDVRARLGAAQGDVLALTVSRLGREKNLERIIDALALDCRTNLRLAIVGEGPHRATLERYVKERRLAERVRFSGHMERAELPDVYASADVFLFSSLSETQGIVLAEALAAGCRIVAVDTPQTRDVLRDAARYVPDDAGAMAAALRRVEGPAGAADQAKSKAAAAQFSRELQAERTAKLYEDLIGQSRRS